MRFNEQLHKNLKRKYYRGLRLEGGSIEYRETYLTTELFYAITYAKRKDGEYGEVREYNIIKPLNIFNARHSIDLLKLQKNMEIPSHWIDILKNKDWIDLPRALILDVLENLGYDGYFNWEVENFPAVGIFNEFNLTCLKTLRFNDFLKDEKFSKTLNIQLRKIDRIIVYFKNKGTDKSKLIQKIKNICPLIPTHMIDENDIIKKFDDLDTDFARKLVESFMEEKHNYVLNYIGEADNFD
jgi:hypothetical protein